jgi:hypothetical protein
MFNIPENLQNLLHPTTRMYLDRANSCNELRSFTRIVTSFTIDSKIHHTLFGRSGAGFINGSDFS